MLWESKRLRIHIYIIYVYGSSHVTLAKLLVYRRVCNKPVQLMESLEGGGIWERQNSSNFIVSSQNMRVLWLLL